MTRPGNDLTPDNAKQSVESLLARCSASKHYGFQINHRFRRDDDEPLDDDISHDARMRIRTAKEMWEISFYPNNNHECWYFADASLYLVLRELAAYLDAKGAVDG